MGKADASEQEMWNALKHAGIADLFQEKEGLQTPVKEGGSNFSGGQRQRLALARLLLKNSEVMILDESTSNVDVESEDQIIQTIKDLDDKTIIMISHRLNHSMDADRIYVLKEGAIQEVGDHETLLKNKGEYARLWNAQQNLERYNGGTQDEAK